MALAERGKITLCQPSRIEHRLFVQLAQIKMSVETNKFAVKLNCDKTKVTTDWIVRQIREGKAYRFYLTADWQKVRDAKKQKNITNANAVVLWVSTALARRCIISCI